MSKHTPGSWTAERNSALGDCWVVADKVSVCALYYGGTEGWANACLIAAAPDMLGELKRYYQAAEGAWHELAAQGGEDALVQSGRESLDATAALIAKAEGRE